MSPDVKQIIRDFISVQYYNRKLIGLNLRLEDLDNQLTWGHRPGVELSKKQMASVLPMPTNTMRYMTSTDWTLWEEIEKTEKEIIKYRSRIMELKPLESVSKIDMNLMADMYWTSMKPVDVADKYGYSVSGLYKHINTVISKVLMNMELFR